MKKIRLAIPGKTFLAGEYLALMGMEALVIATKPKFEFTIFESRNSKNPFHPDSAAGQFWQEHSDYFFQFSIEMMSPYKKGGWGGSTAEFIALHSLYQLRESLWVEQERDFDLHEMLADYKRLTATTSKYSPSGADLVGQVRGGLTSFESRNGKIQTFAWPFSELKLFLIGTGEKKATHEHLKTLEDFTTARMESAVAQIHDGLKAVSESQFLAGVREFGQALDGEGLVAEHTRKLFNQLQNPDVMAMKGCGALGADVISVYVRNSPNALEKFKARIKALDLEISATEESVSDGLSFQLENDDYKEVRT